MANTSAIRVVTIDGNPWFLAVDALRSMGFALGYSGSASHLLKLDDSEKMLVPTDLIRGKGMNQAKLISESGLYKLAMRSDLMTAKPFQDWVTKTVLPAIRKDGGYIMGACPQALPCGGEEVVRSSM